MSLCFALQRHNRKKKQENSLSIRQLICRPFTDILYSMPMKNRGTSWCICQKASFTVEAAVVLPFFVCFMVFVLYFFRILQVQAGVAQSLQYTGRRMAAECCIQSQNMLSNLGNIAKAKLFFNQELKKQNCPTQYIKGGISGIHFTQSDFSGNYIELKAVYRMRLPIDLLGKIQYQIVQESKCRKWTGYQLGQDGQQEDDWLYYTEHGTVYHASRSCTHLDLSIHGISYLTLDQNRNNSGGKYHACERCGGAENQGMVYITDYGDRYHNSLTCSGLKRTIYMIRRSKAAEKRMCRKCGG